MAMTPDQQDIFFVLVVSGGPGAGEFVYDASGNLRYSNVGQPTTDPVQGISCKQGVTTYNGHGAVLNLLSTGASNAGFFQYFDNGSAVQGSLILAIASTSGTDPVNGTTYAAGVTGIDPVFGDSVQVVGANINLSQGPFTKSANITANTGSGATSPFLHAAGPEQGHAGHAVLRVYGVSADGTVPGGVIVSTTDPPVRAAAAALEVQGSQALLGIATPGAPPAGNGLLFADISGYLRALTGAAGDTNVYGVARRIFTATGQLVNSLVAQTVAGIGVTNGVAAAKYLVRGCIIIAQGAGGAGHQGVRFTGPAVSSMHVSFNCIEGTTIFNSGVLTATGTDMDSGAIPINTTAELHFDGIITFSASGATFGMQCDCITAVTDTWTLTADSYLELIPA